MIMDNNQSFLIFIDRKCFDQCDTCIGTHAPYKGLIADPVDFFPCLNLQ